MIPRLQREYGRGTRTKHKDVERHRATSQNEEIERDRHRAKRTLLIERLSRVDRKWSRWLNWFEESDICDSDVRVVSCDVRMKTCRKTSPVEHIFSIILQLLTVTMEDGNILP